MSLSIEDKPFYVGGINAGLISLIYRIYLIRYYQLVSDSPRQFYFTLSSSSISTVSFSLVDVYREGISGKSLEA